MQTADYYLKNPYLLKWNLTVERQLPAGIGLQVAYVGTRGMHLYQVIEGNPNLPTAVVNGLPYWNGTEPRQNPNFSSMSVHEHNRLVHIPCPAGGPEQARVPWGPIPDVVHI